jgi:hypothetical protein
MQRFEHVELTLEYASGTWRDSTGRQGVLEDLSRERYGELVAQFVAEGWTDAAVSPRAAAGRFTMTFRRSAPAV